MRVGQGIYAVSKGFYEAVAGSQRGEDPSESNNPGP